MKSLEVQDFPTIPQCIVLVLRWKVKIKKKLRKEKEFWEDGIFKVARLQTFVNTSALIKDKMLLGDRKPNLTTHQSWGILLLNST